ncbi:LytR/AlgR family response regulator transcription factor [Algoriphagus sediminis]|uniref:LytTR family transcriptional regulator DNA-binding domain-containing protein n=1 Tax=Algoriphagus sediminis TaxID=3057113 RepID=A0ABT7YG88_9BACT|nr:LytTR family transcriptional regulator DNA-binding domain-containing protein [Algoriphagus sediminis]MDN3205512.1 LytTR family transcriptional regulator DNA-binding domain-containing protein [Algoriphagus sediminis]
MIRTLIIDDEPLAAGVVEEYLTSFPQFEVLGTCHNGFQGLKTIQELKPDLIFLDVQMPKITGFEMLELVDDPPAVIFTTAFDEYAVKAFDAKAIDYLLKPFSTERFSQAIDRFLDQRSAGQSTDESETITALAEKSSRLVVRVKNEIKVIATSEVIYFEAQDDYVAIHTKDGKYLKKLTMKSLEASLSESPFVRCHRSYMVNMDQISKIEPYEKDHYILKLKNGETIPVSKSGYSRLRQVLGI